MPRPYHRGMDDIADLLALSAEYGRQFDALIRANAPIEEVDEALARLRAVSADLARAVDAV